MNKKKILLNLFSVFSLSFYAYVEAKTESNVIKHKKSVVRSDRGKVSSPKKEFSAHIIRRNQRIDHQNRQKSLYVRNQNNWQRRNNQNIRDPWGHDSRHNWNGNWRDDSWQNDENQQEIADWEKRDTWEAKKKQREHSIKQERSKQKSNWGKRDRGGRKEKSHSLGGCSHCRPKSSKNDNDLKKAKKNLAKISMETKEANCKIDYLLKVIESAICELENCDPCERLEAVQSKLLALETSSEAHAEFETIKNQLTDLTQTVYDLQSSIEVIASGDSSSYLESIQNNINDYDLSSQFELIEDSFNAIEDTLNLDILDNINFNTSLLETIQTTLNNTVSIEALNEVNSKILTLQTSINTITACNPCSRLDALQSVVGSIQEIVSHIPLLSGS